MKLLITGASGLLGSRLVRLARDAGHEVRATYHSDRAEGNDAEQLDIVNEASVNRTLSNNPPDAVIHTASITDVDFCEKNPEAARLVNGIATRFIANACRKLGAFLVYVSTDYVFDGQRGEYNEQDEPCPINVYGSSKLMGEQEASTSLEGLAIVRTSVVYGWGRPHRPNFGTWLYKNLSEGRNVNVVTDQRVSPTLNTSLARMLLEVTERKLTGTIHLAGATSLSRYDFAIKLASAFRLNEKLLKPIASTNLTWVANRPRDSSLDVHKALETLGHKPVTVDEALQEFALERPSSRTR